MGSIDRPVGIAVWDFDVVNAQFLCQALRFALPIHDADGHDARNDALPGVLTHSAAYPVEF